MTYPPRPYRSDKSSRISYALHHRTLEIILWALVIAVPFGLWLGTDFGPFEIMHAKGGF
jgi:hypothetical protein